MGLFHCNGCNKDIEYADNEHPVIHICGSCDIDRICPVCRCKYEYIEQKKCTHCLNAALKEYEDIMNGKD